VQHALHAHAGFAAAGRAGEERAPADGGSDLGDLCLCESHS
jgi:hypothetical protein